MTNGKIERNYKCKTLLHKEFCLHNPTVAKFPISVHIRVALKRCVYTFLLFYPLADLSCSFYDAFCSYCYRKCTKVLLVLKYRTHFHARLRSLETAEKWMYMKNGYNFLRTKFVCSTTVHFERFSLLILSVLGANTVVCFLDTHIMPVIMAS